MFTPAKLREVRESETRRSERRTPALTRVRDETPRRRKSPERMMTPIRLNVGPAKMMTPGASIALSLNTETTPITHQTVFASTPEYAISLYSAHPLHAHTILSTRDTLLTESTATVSTYTLLSTPNHLVLWNTIPNAQYKVLDIPWKHATKAPLTLITPSLINNPLHSGVLAVTHDGHVRYWQDITTQEYTDSSLSLPSNDYFISLTSALPAGYVLASKNGLLFKSVQGGQGVDVSLSWTELKPAETLFQRTRKSFYIAPAKDPIVTVTASPRTDSKVDRDVYVLCEESVEKWTVSRGFSDEKCKSVNLGARVREYASGVYTDVLNTRLIDLQFNTNGEIYVLCAAQRLQKSYYFILNVSFDVASCLIHTARSLFHSTLPQVIKEPRLFLCGKVAFVAFSDAVEGVSLTDNTTYNQIMKIADVIGDCVIGAEIVAKDVGSAVLRVVLNQSGTVDITVNVEAALASHCDMHDLTREFGSRLEQTLRYTHIGKSYNPFTFNYWQFNGHVDQETLRISSQILARNTHCSLSNRVDKSEGGNLVYELSEKFRMLDEIMFCLQGWRVTPSKETRVVLSEHASIALTAVHLWMYQNSFQRFSLLHPTPMNRELDDGTSRFNVLQNALDAFNKENKSVGTLRGFFGGSLDRLSGLIVHLDAGIQDALNPLHLYYINHVLDIALSNPIEYVLASEYIYTLGNDPFRRFTSFPSKPSLIRRFVGCCRGD